ncbi:protein of unknown function [Streptantibioticus cattleyicolor NRRL 8057 = DSM 46488]|nr:protein of unknown function [Streptantibioticus cattleyicolor NRRL 8057 = DSM 46488]
MVDITPSQVVLVQSRAPVRHPAGVVTGGG